jgi:hypothetical protein
MKSGYARTNTNGMTALQLAALKREGCYFRLSAALLFSSSLRFST